MAIPNRLPGVTYAALPKAAARASSLSLPPRLVVIHDTSNNASAAAEASYAANRTDSASTWTSAHFYVDGTGPLGSVPLNIQAWAAYSYANSHGWHIEMCGYNAGLPGAVPAKTIGLTAGLTRQLCELAGIPMVKLSPTDVAAGKRGICGHRDITIGLNVGTHDDPGPNFDWPAFIAAVNGDDMALTDADIPVIRRAIMGYADAGARSFHDQFFGDLVPAAKSAVDGINALNAKISAISAVDPAQVAAALAANPEFAHAVAVAVADELRNRLAE